MYAFDEVMKLLGLEKNELVQSLFKFTDEKSKINLCGLLSGELMTGHHI